MRALLVASWMVAKRAMQKRALISRCAGPSSFPYTDRTVELDRFRQVGAVSSGWRVGAVSSGWSGFVRLERFGQVSASRSNSTSLSVARSREIELLAEFTALLGCLVRRVHERAPQLISKLEQQPRSSRDRRTLERLLVRLKIEIELQIEIELEIAVVEGMAHSFVCEDLLHAPCE